MNPGGSTDNPENPESQSESNPEGDKNPAIVNGNSHEKPLVNGSVEDPNLVPIIGASSSQNESNSTAISNQSSNEKWVYYDDDEFLDHSDPEVNSDADSDYGGGGGRKKKSGRGRGR